MILTRSMRRSRDSSSVKVHPSASTDMCSPLSGVEADERLAVEWKIRSRAARGDRNAQAWLRQNLDKR